MVSCRKCKFFEQMNDVMFFGGFCHHEAIEDYIEEEFTDNGECDLYVTLDADNTERTSDEA